MGKSKATGIAPIVIMIVSVFTAVIIVTAEPTEETDQAQTIHELQQWIYDQGYNYIVAENWISSLPPEDRTAICGYKQIEAPEENISENVRFVSDVPKAKAETEKFGQPSSYDAMALGYVTPVKNQGACGSCWIFGATADFESSVAIGESNLLDFSEQEVGDCNIWSRVGGYNFCEGGNAFMTTNYFTKYGSANESCHPYAAIPQTCQNCPILKNVDNWRMITGDDGESQITTIKNAILTYGPVYSTIYASGPGFGSYSGGVYEYWGTESPNHAIEIIGWDDSLPHSQGTGAWMIKNSFGTDWGASGPYPGCAWVAYGAANLGDYTSAVSGYKTPDDVIFYHDECGWMRWCYGYGATTAYGAVRFTPSQDLTLNTVDFWAVAPDMQYEIKIFDTLNTYPTYYTFSNQLVTTQTGTTEEQGYYSISLDTPVELVSGDDFIVQVKLTTTGWGYPIPIDYCTKTWLPDWSGIASFSGESYCSSDGAQFLKPFGSGEYFDIGIRARAQEVSPTPDLVITEKWVCWPDNCTICYTVTNTGNGTVPAGHNTTLYVDGDETAHDQVPVDLAHNESYIGCFDDYSWIYTPPEDNITVCADNNETVDESDEGNNCLTNRWKCGDVDGDGSPTITDARITVGKMYGEAWCAGYPDWPADADCDKTPTITDARIIVGKMYGEAWCAEYNCCCMLV